MRLTQKQMWELVDLCDHWSFSSAQKPEPVGKKWVWVPITSPLEALVKKRLAGKKHWPGADTHDGLAAYYPTRLGQEFAEMARPALHILGRCKALARDAKRMIGHGDPQ